MFGNGHRLLQPRQMITCFLYTTTAGLQNTDGVIITAALYSRIKHTVGVHYSLLLPIGFLDCTTEDSHVRKYRLLFTVGNLWTRVVV